MSGFVQIHRSLLGHHAFRNDAEALAFAWMVVRAAWRPTRVRYKERSISLQRGQLSVSQRDMASALDRDKAWIERLWKRLKSEAMIEAVSEAGVTIITICNYDRYQDPRGNGEAANEAPHETGARQGQGTEQEGNKGRRKKEESYAFEGRTIRLGRADFEAWQRAYGAIPDLIAELQALDDWLGEQTDDVREKWFFRVSGALKNKNADYQERASHAAYPPGHSGVPL
jgi:hypothetical protein